MEEGRLSHKKSKIPEIKAQLKPGTILHLYCDFIENPKDKFVVVVHVDHEDDLLIVFLVNSKISKLIENDPHLKAGQISMKKSVYTFLDHDSHLNCTEVKYGLDMNYAIDHLLKTPNDYKGDLLDEEKQQIIAFVRISQTITDVDRTLIMKSLGG